MHHIIHWLLDFIGVNNSYDVFSTKMYNFWSGFGGGVIQFSLLGAIVAIYRHYLSRNKIIKYVTDRSPLLHHEETETPKKTK